MANDRLSVAQAAIAARDVEAKAENAFKSLLEKTEAQTARDAASLQKAEDWAAQKLREKDTLAHTAHVPVVARRAQDAAPTATAH